MWEQKPESKPVCVKSCGRYQPEDQMVYIDYYVMAKINALMKKYTNLEWLGYLVGRDGNIVDDVYLPKQKVSAGSVTDIEVIPEISIIGVIHSHHGLGLHNFSGTDHAYINDNHRLSILVWHEKDHIGINGQNKITLECGSTMIVPIKIEFFHPELDLTQWVAEADENISTIVYHPAANAYGRYVDGRYIPYNAYGYIGPGGKYSAEKYTGSGKYSASEKKSGGKQKNDVREMHSVWQGSASLEECIDLVVGEDDDDLVSETDAILTELRSWRDPS